MLFDTLRNRTKRLNEVSDSPIPTEAESNSPDIARRAEEVDFSERLVPIAVAAKFLDMNEDNLLAHCARGRLMDALPLREETGNTFIDSWRLASYKLRRDNAGKLPTNAKLIPLEQAALILDMPVDQVNNLVNSGALKTDRQHGQIMVSVASLELRLELYARSGYVPAEQLWMAEAGYIPVEVREMRRNAEKKAVALELHAKRQRDDVGEAQKEFSQLLKDNPPDVVARALAILNCGGKG